MPHFLAEVGTRIENTVLQVFNDGPMKSVRTRLKGDIRYRTDGSSELGLKVIRCNVYRLNGIRRWNHDLEQACTLIIINSLNLVTVSHAWNAVNFCLQGTLRIKKL